MAHNKEKVELFKDIIRKPYAWPGGYERVAITTDGGVLCHKCLKDEYYNILHSTKYEYNDGWQVDGQMLVEEFDDSLFCDHCGNCLNTNE